MILQWAAGGNEACDDHEEGMPEIRDTKNSYSTSSVLVI